MTDQLIEIIAQEKEKELIIFLKSVTPEERKKLVPTIKKLSKEYEESVQTKPNTWSTRGTPRQRQLCIVASFVCFSRTEFEKQFFAISIVSEETLDAILPWYHPDWLGDFLNGLATAEYAAGYIHYELLLKYMDQGLFKPSKELIVRVLTPYIFREKGLGRRKTGNYDVFEPEKLLKHPITLKEHIWYLFEFDSEIQQSNRFLRFENEKIREEADWLLVFKKFAQQGKIDRKRLLKESLLAGNRNFNKLLTGWFCDLFIQLEATQNELIELQPELFSLLNAPQSKSVNTALQATKQIVEHKSFDASGFIDHAPILFSSTTKSVVTSALQLAEMLAKKNVQLRPFICRAVTRVFLQTDDALQTKAAIFIAAYRKELDPSFADELSAYDSTLMSSARAILGEKSSSKEEDAATAEDKSISNPPAELTPIPSIETIDDLIFLASQATDNNQSWHIDAFPAAMLKFKKELTGEHIAKLEPALQRAIKLIESGFKAKQGKLDHFIATYIVDISTTLVNEFPEQAKPLHEQMAKFAKKREFSIDEWLKIDKGQSNLAELSQDHGNPFYLVYHYLLLVGLHMYRQDLQLPLLSTPSYLPGWIDATVLVDRLVVYQRQNAQPDGIDLQIALSRCHLQNTGKALAQAKKLLSGEYLNLIKFLFGEHKEPEGPFDSPAVWFSASMCLKEKKRYKAFEKFDFYKKPLEYYTGQHAWESVNEEYETERYDYDQKKNVKENAHRKILNIIYPEGHVKTEIKMQQMFEELVKSDPLDYDAGLLLRYMRVESMYFSAEIDKDIRRAILLVPNNVELLLTCILERSLQYPTFWSETTKRGVIAAIQTLHELWEGGGNMAHTFVGTCIVSSDKTISNIAGEIWLKGVCASNIDNAALGKAIGLHLKIEFAPVKRFTDLATQYLYRVSSAHNNSLQILIEHIMAELPEKPIKNLKKLLEIHAELLSVNKTEVADAALAQKISVWKKSK